MRITGIELYHHSPAAYLPADVDPKRRKDRAA